MATPLDAIPVDRPLNLDRIRERLRTRTVGHRLCLCDTVTSTSARLRELAAAGAPEGTVVLAETQTEGQARGGKTWFSPPGVNLYASVLFRPAIPPAAAPVFGFMAPLALCEVIRGYGLAPAIKWPNDVLVRRKKVAGVLAEMSARGELVEHLIIGVGVNLNVTHGALRAALGAGAPAATSLREVLDHSVDRDTFTARFLNAIERWHTAHAEGGGQVLVQAWRDLDIVTGRRVQVRSGAPDLDGRALGVDERGYLQIEDHGGHVHQIVSGDIRMVE